MSSSGRFIRPISMLILFVVMFFCSIPSIDTLSSQEDLTIDNYHQLGCLALKPDKEYLVQYQQDSSLLPYQTYSSPQMSIVLCFRLCRRWVILINANQTTCTCLFTMSKAYQLKKYLGNVLPTSRCSSNDLNIYSLTKEFDILPSISLTHEWSLDGCYYLHGIQTVRANLELTDVNYIEGLDICRKHCQILRTTNYFSFFLSIRKSCYCLPMKFSPIILPLAVRKPLTHCSFLPLIQSRLKTQLNTSDIHTDTVVKIDVQRYCSSAFSFDETLYLCCKFAILSTQTTYSKLSDDTRCSPLLISNEEQWTHLRSLFSAVRGTAFVWIDRNSTYLFNELFANRSRTYPWNDLCLMFNRTDASQSLSFDLLSCSWATSPGHTLCAQKPLETLIADQGEFQVIPRQPLISSLENRTCPPDYLLFNRVCYFVHSSFVSSLRSGEYLCSNQSINSTLVKFSSHEWSNINGTRFFGRTRYDILLEVFYYQLEPKLLTQASNATRTKHWLRLLLGDKHDPDECVLRYFTRASGAFTTLHRCFHGGHPVCQSEPIPKKIVGIPPVRETSRSPEITRGVVTDSATVPSSSSSSSSSLPTSTTTAEITLPITLTPNDSLILSNETSLAMCDNCSTNLLADEDLANNETSMEEQTFLNITSENVTVLAHGSSENYRSLLMIISGPLFALILLLIGVAFLVRYVRRIHGSYSPGQPTLLPSRRRKRRSTTSPASSDVSNAPAVLYTRLQSASSLINADPDLIHPSGHSVSNEDQIQLLPRIVIDKCLPEDPIVEDEEEPFYATVRDSYEK